MSKDVCLLTDGRFSGASHGFCIGHIVPEAFNGGPIGYVKNGDRIKIDAINNTIDLLIGEQEHAKRQAEWTPKPYKHTRGVLYKYARDVADASNGAYTDWNDNSLTKTILTI